MALFLSVTVREWRIRSYEFVNTTATQWAYSEIPGDQGVQIRGEVDKRLSCLTVVALRRVAVSKQPGCGGRQPGVIPSIKFDV